MANEKMGLIGRKVGMTQIFDEDGTVHGVTVIEVGANTVLQVKSEDGPDGYNALQLAFGTQKDQRVTKAQKGHAKKAGVDAMPALVKEIRVGAGELAKHEPGATLGAADVFEAGALADVTARSKGKGHAGVMKRYNFAGFIRSHGTHEFFRHGGSIGTRLTPGRVFPGKKMTGHMGDEQVTVQNLKVVRVDAERNLIFIKGGVPGANGGYVTIRQAAKA